MNEEVNDPATPHPGAQLPAVFVNRFFVSVMDDRVRVSFGEVIGGYETHHLAVTLTHTDATELTALLKRLMDEHSAKALARPKM